MIWAVYKGEELLCTGTVEDCARELGVATSTILFYQYPSYQRRAKIAANRRIAIPLGEEEDE